MRDTLSPLDGVTEVDVDFDGKIATVTCDDSFDSAAALTALQEQFADTTINES